MMKLLRSLFHFKKGFTLVEVLVATALIGILVASFSGFFIQTVKVDASSKSRVLAVRNLDSAGNWFISDFQSARTVPPIVTLTPGSGNFTIFQSLEDSSTSTVTYSISSSGDLCRTTGSGTAHVAQNISRIDYTTGTASTPNTLLVTSTVGSTPFTKTFKVGTRISNSNAELTIMTQNLPGGDDGWPYDEAITVYGGSLPYTWDITSGDYPTWATKVTRVDGTSYIPNGNIININSSTLPVEGTWSFTVTVTDNAGTQVSRDFTLTINPAMSHIINPADPLPFGYIGVPYDPLQFEVDSGGTSPFYWCTTDDPSELPPGMDLSLSGILSGTPTQQVYKVFTLQVTDAAGDSLTTTRSISIIPIPAKFTAVSIVTDDHKSAPTTVTPEDGSYPTRKLYIVVRPKNGYHSVINCDIKNMLTVPIRIRGVTAANGSNGYVTVTYGGILLGNTEIPAGQTDTTGTITLTNNTNKDCGPYTIVVTYEKL